MLNRLNDIRTLEVPDGLTLELPGIYTWTISGVGCYVGKYTRKSRPLKEYNKNVDRLLNKQPYRPGKPDGFRKVHRALAQAVLQGRNIKLSIVANGQNSELIDLERASIESHVWRGLNQTRQAKGTRQRPILGVGEKRPPRGGGSGAARRCPPGGPLISAPHHGRTGRSLVDCPNPLPTCDCTQSLRVGRCPAVPTGRDILARFKQEFGAVASQPPPTSSGPLLDRPKHRVLFRAHQLMQVQMIALNLFKAPIQRGDPVGEVKERDR